MTVGKSSPQAGPSLRTLVGISLFWMPLSLLTDGFTTLVLPSRLFDVPDESRATLLGGITFLGLACAAATQPVAGYVSDRLRPRVGRHAVVAVGVGLVLVSLLAFGVAPSLLGYALAFVLLQVAAAISQSAQQGYLPDQVPTERRGLGAGFKGFMDLAGAMIGFAVLGGLLFVGQLSTALLVAGAITVAVFGLTVLLVREPTIPQVERGPSAWRASYRLELPRDRQFLWVVATRFTFLLGTFAIGRFLFLFVATRLGLDGEQAAGTVGGLLAGLALLTAIAAPPSGWLADRFGRRRVMAAGGLMTALGIVVLAAAGGLLQILAGGGLMALGSASFSAANWALTTELVPPDESARYMGLANIGTAGAAAAAGLFGPLVDISNQAFGSGYAVLFIAAALASAASALMSLRLAPSGQLEAAGDEAPSPSTTSSISS